MTDIASIIRPALSGLGEMALFFAMVHRQKHNGRRGLLTLSVALTGALFALLQIVILSQPIDLFLRLLVCVPTLYYLYGIPLKRSFFLTLVFYLVTSVCKSLLSRPILLGFGFDLTAFTAISAINSWIWALFTFALECGAILLARRFLSTEKSQDIPTVQLLIALLSCVTYMLTRELLRHYSRLNLALGGLDITFAMLALCTATLVVALFSENYFISSRRKQEIETLENLLDLQCENYLHRNEAEDRVREMYHDIKHHLQCIQNISDNSQVQSYVDSINARISQYEQFFRTGNRILDIVLHEKTLQAERNGIRLQVYAAVDSLDFLDAVDLCAILSNALDNALEATMQVHDAERVVHVRIMTVSGCLTIKVENPYSGTLRRENGRLLTSKDNPSMHGLGLISIAHSVEKYGGDYSIRAQDGVFVLSIAIPQPVSPG